MDDRTEALKQIARDNVERHLGDVCDADDDPDTIREEIYVLAFDAVFDAGASAEAARRVAEAIAQEMA